MSQNKVRVIDINSEESLFECDITKLESAYQFAAQMEEMGLEVKVCAPSISETLTESLGMSHDEKEEYEQSVVAEMDDHEGSCCVSEDADIIQPNVSDKLQ
jgi:hypothetical protein